MGSRSVCSTFLASFSKAAAKRNCALFTHSFLLPELMIGTFPIIQSSESWKMLAVFLGMMDPGHPTLWFLTHFEFPARLQVSTCTRTRDLCESSPFLAGHSRKTDAISGLQQVGGVFLSRCQMRKTMGSHWTLFCDAFWSFPLTDEL